MYHQSTNLGKMAIKIPVNLIASRTVPITVEPAVKPRINARELAFEALLAIMRAKVDKETSCSIDWDTEWGNQSEED